MSNLGTPTVSNAIIDHIEGRAAKLVLLIEAATQASQERKIREGGAQLVERIIENMEELREKQANQDIELAEAVDVFHRRLYLAQQLVDTWNIPASIRKRLEKKTAPAESNPAPRRRRRAPKKKAA